MQSHLISFFIEFRLFDKGDNQLAHESAFGTARAKFIRAGEHLAQRRFLALFNQMEESFDAQAVIKIERQQLVAIRKRNPSWQSSFPPPLLNNLITRRDLRIS